MARYYRMKVGGLTHAQASALNEFIISSDRSNTTGMHFTYEAATSTATIDIGILRGTPAFLDTIRTRLQNVSGRALAEDKEIPLSESKHKAREDLIRVSAAKLPEPKGE